jgi:hypothetical protein
MQASLRCVVTMDSHVAASILQVFQGHIRMPDERENLRINVKKKERLLSSFVQ